MQTFDQCLADLVSSGECTFEVAKAAASNPSDFELKMKMFSRISQSSAATDLQPEESATELSGIQTGTLDFLSQ